MDELYTLKEKGAFITLTYADEFLPSDNSLDKFVLQKFFKRFRKAIDKLYDGRKIKYFACGEYGDKNGRPHYHAIILNVTPLEVMSVLSDVWTFGFFNVQPVFFESCKYVTGYVMKKYNGDKAKEVYGNRQPPFRLCSQGLGKEYALSHRDKLIKDKGDMLNGKCQGMPKYYKRLFMRQDIQAAVDANDGKGFDDIGDVINDIKANSPYFQEVVKLAKQRNADEYNSYVRFVEKLNPDAIVDNTPSMSFEMWRASVNRLRDLSLKAKNRLFCKGEL